VGQRRIGDGRAELRGAGGRERSWGGTNLWVTSGSGIVTVQVTKAADALYNAAVATGTVDLRQDRVGNRRRAASQAIAYGASVTLTGVVSAAGPVYPPDGETVAVTINGVTSNAVISGGAGAFLTAFATAGLTSLGRALHDRVRVCR